MPSGKFSIVWTIFVQLDLAFYQPEIAQNTGTMLRMAACFGTRAHIIHPCAFPFSAKELRRSAMDYFDKVDLVEHDSFDRFRSAATNQSRRVILMSTAASKTVYDFEFSPTDIIMVGRESSGVDLAHADQCDDMVRIPMRPDLRSLNVAISASIALTQAIGRTSQYESLT